MPVIKDKISYNNVYSSKYHYKGISFTYNDLIKVLVKEGYTKEHATKIVDNVKGWPNMNKVIEALETIQDSFYYTDDFEKEVNIIKQALTPPTADEIIFLNSFSKELQGQDKIGIDGQATPRFWSVAQYEYRPCWVEQADKHLFYDEEGTSYETFDEVLEMLIENEYIDTKLGYEDIDDLKGIFDEISEVPVKREHIIIQNTMFFTKKECQEHIKSNHYHYNKTVHTYAMTAWRSPQVEKVMKFLTSFFMVEEK